MTYATSWLTGLDYGPRLGTEGWNIHMAEGGDGTANWLARRTGESTTAWRNRVKGVSASFVIQSTGKRIQMVPWSNTAGNLNPNDRSSDNKGFYGRRYLLEVLPTHWTNPNAYTLSVEFCGFRANGITDDQLASFLELNEEARNRYPNMRGAFGHADQTDTKGCPGTANNMLALWRAIGHGRFGSTVTEDDMIEFTLAANEVGGIIEVNNPSGASVVTLDGGDRPLLPFGMVRPVLGQAFLAIRGTTPHYVLFVGTTEIGFVLASDVKFTPNNPSNITQAALEAAIAEAVEQAHQLAKNEVKSKSIAYIQTL